MTNTRTQQIDHTLKAHGQAITEIQATLSALIKQQEEILKAVRDKPTSATVPSPPPAAEALHTPAPPTSVSATQPKSAPLSLVVVPKPPHHSNIQNPALKQAPSPKPIMNKPTDAFKPTPATPTPAPTPSLKPAQPVTQVYTPLVLRPLYMDADEPIKGSKHGTIRRFEWRPPWKWMEMAPNATVRVEWRPPWFTKSYPDFSP